MDILIIFTFNKCNQAVNVLLVLYLLFINCILWSEQLSEQQFCIMADFKERKKERKNKIINKIIAYNI